MEKNIDSPLALFAANEAKIAELYATYARLFPTQEKMWSLLSREEERHVAILKDLEERLRENNKFATAKAHGQEILDYVGRFIDEKLAIARSGRLTPREAVETGLSLERSMVEKKSFEIFSPLGEEMRGALEKMNRETDGHALRLEKALGGLI